METRGPGELEEDPPVGPGVGKILLLGLALGVTFNALALRNGPGKGLAWIAEDRVAAMPNLADLATSAPATTAPSAADYGKFDDPMAVPGGSNGNALPEIPDLGRPIQVDLLAVKKMFDAQAALIADARDPEEFAGGHIAGAINLPYDEVSSDPARLEAISTGGRPIITYCGGGSCELSLSLAWDLIYAGHDRVVVYMGGFPEWEAAGYPVESGAGKS